MDAFRAVHQLRDAEIRRHARRHIGFLAAEFLFRHQKINHFAHGDFGGGCQVFVNAHSHKSGGRFGARPARLHILARDELKLADARSFQGRNADFDVALGGLAVTGLEQREPE